MIRLRLLRVGSCPTTGNRIWWRLCTRRPGFGSLRGSRPSRRDRSRTWALCGTGRGRPLVCAACRTAAASARITESIKPIDNRGTSCSEVKCWYRRDAGVVGQHQSWHPVRRRNVRGFTGQGHLDGCGTPRDERRQFALPNSLQTFVDLRRIDFTLPERSWIELMASNRWARDSFDLSTWMMLRMEV